MPEYYNWIMVYQRYGKTDSEIKYTDSIEELREEMKKLKADNKQHRILGYWALDAKRNNESKN